MNTKQMYLFSKGVFPINEFINNIFSDQKISVRCGSTNQGIVNLICASPHFNFNCNSAAMKFISTAYTNFLSLLLSGCKSSLSTSFSEIPVANSFPVSNNTSPGTVIHVPSPCRISTGSSVIEITFGLNPVFKEKEN